MKSAMSFLSKAFRRKSEGLPPWAALDQESLRIGAAMEHVEKYGNLDTFPGNQNEKLALMLTASRQGLVQWNRGTGQYELTGLGRERLGMRQAMQAGGPRHVEESGGAMHPPPASGAGAPAQRWALGSGTILAGIAGLTIGATAMALLANSGSKAPPREPVAATASKPAESGNPPRQEQAAVAPTPPPAAAPPPAPASSQPEPPKAQSAEPPKAQVTEPPKAPESKQAAMHPGAAGKTAGALAGAEPQASAPPAPAPSANAQAERGAANDTVSANTNETAPAKNETAATNEPKPPPITSAPRLPTRSAKRSRHARRSAKRSRHAPTTPAPAPSAAPPANPEEPGLAQSSDEPSRATERSSRGRHAEHQKTWTESRRRSERSRRNYAEQDEGERKGGVIERGPPVFLHRGGRDLREIEERPGFAYREPREPREPRFRFGGREEGPPRFAPFDWLFR